MKDNDVNYFDDDSSYIVNAGWLSQLHYDKALGMINSDLPDGSVWQRFLLSDPWPAVSWRTVFAERLSNDIMYTVIVMVGLSKITLENGVLVYS